MNQTGSNARSKISNAAASMHWDGGGDRKVREEGGAGAGALGPRSGHRVLRSMHDNNGQSWFEAKISLLRQELLPGPDRTVTRGRRGPSAWTLCRAFLSRPHPWRDLGSLSREAGQGRPVRQGLARV